MMEDQFKDLKFGTANWRAVIKKNNQRTQVVIGSFILIYLCVGFLIDLYISASQYTQMPLSAIFHALVTLQITPYATIAAGIIAVIAILVTFKFHNKFMLMGTNAHEVTAAATDIKEKRLYNVVEEMKVAAGLQYMPKIFIIDAGYMNAFASGYSEQSAMVAITRGLLEKCDRDELTAVMAHELSHIRHMDIKLTLMASVLSNITLIMVDILFWNAVFGGRGDNDNRNGGGGRNALFIIIILLRYILPLITVLLMFYLSRTREYMADAGCAELMRNNEPLARALLKIQQDHQDNKQDYRQSYNNTAHEALRRQAYIFDPVKAGIETKREACDFFSTHPGIKKRLAAIGVKSTK